MSATGRDLRPRHCYIQLIVPQAHDAKTNAHRKPFAKAVQNKLQCRDRNAMDFNIDIFILSSQDLVPDISAHIIRSASDLTHGGSDLAGHFYILVAHFLSPPSNTA